MNLLGLLESLMLSQLAIITLLVAVAVIALVQSVRLYLSQRELRSIRGRVKDYAKRSAAVMTGQVAEQLLPFSDKFRYNPKDARFLGSPIDYVVFDGLEEGNLRAIVFVEVKKGTSRLTDREFQVKEAVEKHAVYFELVRVD